MCRLLRTQIINLGYDIDLGPDQFDLYINDADLKLDQQNDLAKLSRALKEAHEEIRKMKEGVTISPKARQVCKSNASVRGPVGMEHGSPLESIRLDFQLGFGRRVSYVICLRRVETVSAKCLPCHCAQPSLKVSVLYQALCARVERLKLEWSAIKK